MKAAKPVRVLIVDDNASVRGALECALLSCDDLYPIGTAAGGEEALDLCGRVSPDIVLMDVKMPGMDGITATRLIREKYPSTKVIVLTNSITQDTAQEALNAGASTYLTKGVTCDKLLDTIRAAVDGQVGPG